MRRRILFLFTAQPTRREIAKAILTSCDSGVSMKVILIGPDCARVRVERSWENSAREIHREFSGFPMPKGEFVRDVDALSR